MMRKTHSSRLGGTFQTFFFTPKFGEDSHFVDFFQRGWFNHQLVDHGPVGSVVDLHLADQQDDLEEAGVIKLHISVASNNTNPC